MSERAGESGGQLSNTTNSMWMEGQTNYSWGEVIWQPHSIVSSPKFPLLSLSIHVNALTCTIRICLGHRMLWVQIPPKGRYLYAFGQLYLYLRSGVSLLCMNMLACSSSTCVQSFQVVMLQNGSKVVSLYCWPVPRTQVGLKYITSFLLTLQTGSRESTDSSINV